MNWHWSSLMCFHCLVFSRMSSWLTLRSYQKMIFAHPDTYFPQHCLLLHPLGRDISFVTVSQPSSPFTVSPSRLLRPVCLPANPVQSEENDANLCFERQLAIIIPIMSSHNFERATYGRCWCIRRMRCLCMCFEYNRPYWMLLLDKNPENACTQQHPVQCCIQSSNSNS